MRYSAVFVLATSSDELISWIQSSAFIVCFPYECHLMHTCRTIDFPNRVESCPQPPWNADVRYRAESGTDSELESVGASSGFRPTAVVVVRWRDSRMPLQNRSGQSRKLDAHSPPDRFFVPDLRIDDFCVLEIPLEHCFHFAGEGFVDDYGSDFEIQAE